MEKGKSSSLFVNDGSFMERFKQLQEEKGKGATNPPPAISGLPVLKPVISKTGSVTKVNDLRKTNANASGGKLAFSLKQKSKLVAPPVVLDEDEKDDGYSSGNGSIKRQKVGQPNAPVQPTKRVDVVPPSPSDSTVKNVADKLASFVAKNGRQFEHVTRQKNPGDTPFKFLYDESSADYKYYEFRLGVEEKALSQSAERETSQSGYASSATPNTTVAQKSHQQQPNYQIPASALYEAPETDSTGRSGYDESAPAASADPIAMMEYYVKKAAHEERKRQPKQSKDEMPPPASLQGPGKRGHHMGDYVPLEELNKFMSTCNDVAAQKAAQEAADRAKIQADNVGHKLLSKMGWKEGEGLGSSRSGIADPVSAGKVKIDNLGVGATQPGEVTPEDDIYEQYKKRMMLGYRYRPNPLGNPRKAYY